MTTAPRSATERDEWEPERRPTGLLPIGRFRRRTRLSRKALRIYDELDLLRPAWVDPVSGYRYYRPEQAERALLIRLLRDVDMPLERIRAVLDAAAPRARAELLADWWRQVEERVASARGVVSYLTRRLAHEEDQMQPNATLQRLPQQHVLTRIATVAIDELDGHIRNSIHELRRRAETATLTPAGEPFAIYRDEVGDDEPGTVEVCLPVSAPPADGDDSVTLAETEAAVADIPAGDADYPRILGAYEAVAKWIDEQGRRIADDPREVYLREPDANGYGDVPADERVLRIVWPVR